MNKSLLSCGVEYAIEVYSNNDKVSFVYWWLPTHNFNNLIFSWSFACWNNFMARLHANDIKLYMAARNGDKLSTSLNWICCL